MCKSCRSRQELSNEIAIQTSIYLQNLASIQPRTSPLQFAASRSATAPRLRPRTSPVHKGVRRGRHRRRLRHRRGRREENAASGQTLGGSFSAVSKPNFASKYSFESSWRDLEDLHAFAPLSIQNFSQISSIFFAFLQFLFSNFIFLQQSCIKFTNVMKIHWNFSILY